MPFANDDLRFLYDQSWALADQIAANRDATNDDAQFRDDVQDLIRWRKGEIEYPFEEAPTVDAFLDVGLPVIQIGNGYSVIDARNFVPTARPYSYRPRSQIARFSIHHTVTRSPTTKQDELDLLEEIGRYHIDGNGWPAYAYHWSIAPS